MNAAAQIEITQSWGDSLLRVERYSRWRRVTVGPLGRSDFAAGLDVPTVLVDRGVVRGDDGEFEITADTDVLVDVGEQTFRVRAVSPERAVGGALFAHVDWFFVGVMLIGLVTLILGTAFTLLAIVVFLAFRYLLAILFALLHLSVPVMLQMPMVVPPPPVVVAQAKIAPLQPAAPASPAPLFVMPTPKPIPTMEPMPIGDIYSAKLTKKMPARERVEMLSAFSEENVAILGMLRSSDDDEVFGGLVGRGELHVAELRGVSGAGIGEAGGGRGDLHVGGGGSAAGIGGLGTRGTGRGTGGDVALTRKKVEPTRVVEEDDDEGAEDGVEVGGVEGGVVGGVVGGYVGSAPPPGILSREQVSATIQSYLPKIRACYAKALVTDPTVEGRVFVTIRVDSTGRVASAYVMSSTIHSIDSCVLAEAKAMQFPEPAGGGTATVTYPFVFKNVP